MKAKAEPPDIAILRRLCGQKHPPGESATVEEYIRPGRWRKTYGRTAPERWVYRATIQVLRRQLRPPEQIMPHVDKRPLLELSDQIRALLEQVCARAACGDEQALMLMISTARGAISTLKSLDKAQPTMVQAAAEVSSNWPVLLSLNPQDIKHAKQELDRLQVGTKPLTPRRPRQRLDPQNFWTKLAAGALEACEQNRILVPELKRMAAGSSRERNNLDFWQTPAKATFYYLNACDCVIIADWEKQCAKLSGPITDTNFKNWWSVVQFYVLERWKGSQEEYDAALTRISDSKAPKEFQKRNLAMTQVRKAFRSLVGLRQ